MPESTTGRRAGRWIAPLAALLALAIAAASWAARTPRRTSHRIVLGVSTLRISLPVFVAAEQGLFRARGLDVELRPYETAQPMMDDVSLGHIDAAGFAAYPIVFNSSRRATRPLYVATSLREDAEHRLSYVLARAGSGLSFPRDAARHRIGILPTIAYRRWLTAILRNANVDTDTVSIVPVDPSMQAQSLREGAVDLLFTNDPMATAIVANGVGEVVDDGPPCSTRLGEPFEFGTFVLGGALAEDRGSEASRLTDAIDSAIGRIREDPARARRDMARYLRPEQRRFVDRYPPSAYATTHETGTDFVSAEVRHERMLGIVEHDPLVRRWTAHPR